MCKGAPEGPLVAEIDLSRAVADKLKLDLTARDKCVDDLYVYLYMCLILCIFVYMYFTY